MKFLCPNCKAKYQISDEKIAGRTLKMDCRRCSHAIVIRGDKVAAAAGRRQTGRNTGRGSAVARARGSSHVGPAPARGGSRGALGADFRKNAGAAPAAQRSTALDQWHVAINDVPVGPMKRDEVSNKIQAGAIDGSSLCWREGLDDWRPLRDVPELNALLRRVSQPPAPPKGSFPSPARAMAPRAGSSRPAPARRAPRAEPPGRPADSARPAARGNVVPIGGRAGGSAAPAMEEMGDFLEEDDEPTRVGSAIDFEALQRPDAGPQAPSHELAPHAPSRGADPFAPASPAAASASAAPLTPTPFAPDPFAPAPSAPTPFASSPPTPAPSGATPFAAGPVAAPTPLPDPFAPGAPFAPRSPSSPPPAGLAPGPTDSSPGAAAVASSPGLAATAEMGPGLAPTPEAPVAAQVGPDSGRRRGLPIGAWIAIAGAMAFGVALAVMVGQSFLSRPTEVVAVPIPVAPAPDPTPPPVEQELVLPDEAPEVPDVEPESDEEGAEQESTASAGSSQGRTGGRSGASAGSSTGTTPVAAPTRGGRRAAVDSATAARLARFSDDTAGPAPVTVRRSTALDEERSGSGGGGLNGDQIRSVVTRERSGVQRCYETASRAAGQAPRVRVDLTVSISGSGSVTSASGSGESFGSLTECIERTVGRWRFPATGGATRTSIPFVFSGRE